MPSPLARLDGDMSRLDRGLVRHHAVSTPSPKAVSAVPSGRGLTAGSCRGRPWATLSPAVRDGDAVAPPGEPGPGEPEPHPARASPATPAAAARPAAASRRERPERRAHADVMSRLWVHPRDLGPDPGQFRLVGHALEVVARRVRPLQLSQFVPGQLEVQRG